MPIPLPPMPPPTPIPRPQVPMPPLSWRHDSGLGEKLIKQQQNEEKEAAERKPTLGEILDELLHVE